MPNDHRDGDRTLLFISKATPQDDDFVLWLAPRLEAAGYEVFADIKSLQPGDRWRREITSTLYNRAIKMLLCCSDVTLNKEGVQEEIGIALDLAKQLKDPRFIIPLRTAPYQKLFGIGELQRINFERSWAEGLDQLLEALRRQKVPKRSADTITISREWDQYRRRKARPIEAVPERLTSNWLRMVSSPEVIRYYEPTGFVDRTSLQIACNASSYPTEAFMSGFLSFGLPEEVNEQFIGIGKFEAKATISLSHFMEHGLEAMELRGSDAAKKVVSMVRQAWEKACLDRGMLRYEYSKASGFHVSDNLAPPGKRVAWGRQGERRSAALCNIAKGHAWQFGVSALPYFWPFPHIRLKSRVLFAETVEGKVGKVYTDARKQHRLRRSVCKGWRNRQWLGRLMAYLELMSGESSYIHLPLSQSQSIRLDATPLLFTSPVSTFLPKNLEDWEEEDDESTIGRPEPEDDE